MRTLLHPAHLGGEQAGFVSLDTPDGLPLLRMAGGELCLNATRALGVLLHAEQRLAPVPGALEHDQQYQYLVRTSGCDTPVQLRVTLTDAGYDAAVSLPLALPPCDTPEPGVVIVRLPGITHILLDASLHPFPAAWQAAHAAMCARYIPEGAPATGCIWWRREGDMFRIDPVVAVTHPYTICHESACGSGALALALAMRRGAPDAECIVMQPSGLPISVRLTQEAEHNTCTARVSGPTLLVARGHAYVGPHCGGDPKD